MQFSFMSEKTLNNQKGFHAGCERRCQDLDEAVGDAGDLLKAGGHVAALADAALHLILEVGVCSDGIDDALPGLLRDAAEVAGVDVGSGGHQDDGEDQKKTHGG